MRPFARALFVALSTEVRRGVPPNVHSAADNLGAEGVGVMGGVVVVVVAAIAAIEESHLCLAIGHSW